MVFTKERIYKSLIFAYLIIFPFGQILRTSFYVFGKYIRLHPVDLIAFLILLLWLFEKSKKPKVYPWVKTIALTSVFSLLFSLSIFQLKEIYIGGLYLVRVFTYISVFLMSWDILRQENNLKHKLYNSLIIVSAVTAVFGWIQYILYPDLRAIAAYGWDDHYFRLIGTFLDPGFTGIILVFGLMLTYAKYHKTKKLPLIYLSAFFLATIAFTYSRASYLATLAGLITLLYLKGKLKIFLTALIFFLSLILILPQPGGEGVNLGRTNSILQRVTNYSESWQLFKESPIFGIGFNNLCVYREKYLDSIITDAHSCSGTDSSLLFILATTGILGFIVISGLIFVVVKSVTGNIYGLALLASITSLFIHSFFHNSLFYPWVMGYLAILSGVALNHSKEKS